MWRCAAPLRRGQHGPYKKRQHERTDESANRVSSFKDSQEVHDSYGDATTSASSSSTRTVDGTECAYAPAKITGEPLLFKGDNFAQTDIKSAEQ